LQSPHRVAAHTDYAVKGGIDECAAIETVANQRLFGLALRAVVGAVAVGVGDLFDVLLDRPCEWV
jgi:hypothetical protein